MRRLILLLVFSVLPYLLGAQTSQINVVSSTPSNGETQVTVIDTVSITFDLALDTETIGFSPEAFIAAFPSDSIEISGLAFTNDNKTVNFVVEQTPNTDFTWFVYNIAAADSNAQLGAFYSFNYTTADNLGEYVIAGSIVEAEFDWGVLTEKIASHNDKINKSLPFGGKASKTTFAHKPILIEDEGLDFSYGLVLVLDTEPGSLFGDDEPDSTYEKYAYKIFHELTDGHEDDSTHYDDGEGDGGPPPGVVSATIVNSDGTFEVNNMRNGTYYLLAYLFSSESIGGEPYAAGVYDPDFNDEADSIVVSDANVIGLELGVINFDEVFGPKSLKEIFFNMKEAIMSTLGSDASLIFASGFDFEYQNNEQMDDYEKSVSSLQSYPTPSGLSQVWNFTVFHPDSMAVYTFVNTPFGAGYFRAFDVTDSENLPNPMPRLDTVYTDSYEAVSIAEMAGGEDFRSTFNEMDSYLSVSYTLYSAPFFDEIYEDSTLDDQAWSVYYEYETYDYELNESVYGINAFLIDDETGDFILNKNVIDGGHGGPPSPMYVVDTSPSDGTTSVQLTDTIRITFDKQINTNFFQSEPDEYIFVAPEDSIEIQEVFYENDEETIVLVANHTPDTDFSWFVYNMVGTDGSQLGEFYEFAYTTADNVTDNSISGSLFMLDFGDDGKNDDFTESHSDSLEDRFAMVIRTTISPDYIFADDDMKTKMNDFARKKFISSVMDEHEDDSTYHDEENNLLGVVDFAVVKGEGQYSFEAVRNGEYYLLAYVFSPFSREDYYNREVLAMGIYDSNMDFSADPVSVEDNSPMGVDIGLFILDDNGGGGNEDPVPTYVVDAFPMNKSTNVGLLDTVSIVFDQPIDPFYFLETPEAFLLPFPSDSLVVDEVFMSDGGTTINLVASHTPNTDFTWVAFNMINMTGGQLGEFYEFSYTTADNFSDVTVSGFVESVSINFGDEVMEKQVEHSLEKASNLFGQYKSAPVQKKRMIKEESMSDLDYSFGLVLLTSISPDSIFNDLDLEEDVKKYAQKQFLRMVNDSTDYDDEDPDDGPPAGVVDATLVNMDGTFTFDGVRDGDYYLISYLFTSYSETTGKDVYAFGVHDANGDLVPDQITVDGLNVEDVAVSVIDLRQFLLGSTLSEVFDYMSPVITTILGENAHIINIEGYEAMYSNEEMLKSDGSQLNELPPPSGTSFIWTFGVYQPDSSIYYFFVDSPTEIGFYPAFTVDPDSVPSELPRITMVHTDSDVAVGLAEENGGADLRNSMDDEGTYMGIYFGLDSDISMGQFEGVLTEYSGQMWNVVYEYSTYDFETNEYDFGNHVVLIDDETAIVLYSDELTDVSNEVSTEVVTFALDQNYPNPFNPSTTISFSIPQASKVNISVYNSIGQRVKVLTNNTFNAGNYKVTFDASTLSSGVYFYRIIAGDFTATKSMVLVK